MKIPTLLALSLLIMAIGLGIVIFKYNQKVVVFSKVQLQPESINIVNITDISAVAVWQTVNLTTGSIKLFSDSGEKEEFDDRDQNDQAARITHFVSIKNLQPDTFYTFQIKSGGHLFSEETLSFKTAKKANDQKSITLKPILGTIKTQEQQPLGEGLVILETPEGSTLATYTTIAGNFLLPLTELRDRELSQEFPAENVEAKLIVQKGDLTSNVQIKLSSKEQRALPPIIIGQNADYTDLPPLPTFFEEADLNQDGVVNSLDLSIIFNNLGKNPKEKRADLNNDGIVDGKDVDLIKRTLGNELSY